MSIIKGYFLPHPPLAVPDVGRGKEGEIQDTLDALDEVAKEIANLAPETIIYLTPHSTVYADYFHISPGGSARGDLGNFGASHVKFDVEYDRDLVYEIAASANKDEILAGDIGEEDASLDHGTMVPMWFINRRYKDYKVVRISPSGMTPGEHYHFGMSIAKGVEQSGRKVVLVASGDLSHRLTESGPYGYAMEGEMFDQTITTILTYGDYLPLLLTADNLRSAAAECGFNSLAIMAGCFDRQKVETRLFSYEGPFGVGYAVGSVAPIGADQNRNFLDKVIQIAAKNAALKKRKESPYQQLARKSLEHRVKTGERLGVPDGLPRELTDSEAGVFVSIYKNGRLRGCVGTIAPTTASIASEIIQNAVSAGIYDNRFDEVKALELDELTYNVDVLSPPEEIASIRELDVKKYGVIVTKGMKRGLLLPDLEGIDTVEEQVAIAKQKAGISENEKVKLERFLVTRYGQEA